MKHLLLHIKSSILLLLLVWTIAYLPTQQVAAQFIESHTYKYKHKPKNVIKSWEVGILLAETHYFGDLASYIPSPSILHFAGGFFVRYQYNPYWAFRAGYNQGAISGNDAYLYKDYFKDRDLNFESNINEGHLIAEFSPSPFSVCRHKSLVRYFFAGIAVFHFNPYTFYNGQLVYLQPLNTEGQGSPDYPERKPYALTQISIPFGTGFKLALKQNLIIGIEIGFRKTFTDYLDDVSTTYAAPKAIAANTGGLAVALADRTPYDGSLTWHPGFTRGNPNYKDWYFFNGITISKLLISPCLKYHEPKKRKLYKCPKMSEKSH